MISKLTSETFAGNDPVSQLNGVTNPAHDIGDYLEDVLAFEWLEQQKPGNVEAFSKGLLWGEDWQELLASTSGFGVDETFSRMDRHCRERVEGALGKAGREAIVLRDTYYARGKEGAGALRPGSGGKEIVNLPNGWTGIPGMSLNRWFGFTVDAD